MKHKYMIPLVLCGLMIACVAPAFATTHDITSGTDQKIESRLYSNGGTPAAQWNGNSYTPNPGVDSGDQITWNNYLKHDCSIASAQFGTVHNKMNNVEVGHGVYLNYGDRQSKQETRTAMYTQTFDIWHTYDGSQVGTKGSSLTIQ